MMNKKWITIRIATVVAVLFGFLIWSGVQQARRMQQASKALEAKMEREREEKLNQAEQKTNRPANEEAALQ
jgi:uncharacterized membrane-anchored protein YhcB (DUF1043 family)